MNGFAGSELTLGQANAIVKMFGGMEGVKRFLRGELVIAEPTRSWQEKDGVITFSVTSDGTTGEAWITRLEAKGFRLSGYAKSVLRSQKFQPTNGATTQVAVLKGMLFNDNDRSTSTVRTEATRRNLEKPNAEVACLIREKFTDEEIEAMGLIWLVTMHEPIEGTRILGMSRCVDGQWLDVFYHESDRPWNCATGFAFAVV